VTERSTSRAYDEAVQAFIDAARAHSTATVLMHSAMAAEFGLSATDWKSLDVLTRCGPLTAGQLGRHTALTSASVTALIDRLESKGFVCRTRDPEDRRRVVVEVVPEAMQRIGRSFDDVEAAVEELLRPYTLEQLRFLTEFLDQATTWVHARLARAAPPAPPAPAMGADVAERADV
jgi:DNA-binding MarR family transcriptional regulator